MSCDGLRNTDDTGVQNVSGRALAESHVYTTPDELTRTISLPPSARLAASWVCSACVLSWLWREPPSVSIRSPANTGRRSSGRSSTAAPIASRPTAFLCFRRRRTARPDRRQDQVAKHLQELGVWLLDASLAALFCQADQRQIKQPEVVFRLAGIITFAA